MTTEHAGKTTADGGRTRGQLAGPTGLGTSAARIAEQLVRAAEQVARAARTGDHDPPAPPPEAAPSGDPAYAMRPWGDGSFPPLYCPRTERIDEPLAAAVDERLFAWAREVGFSEDDVGKMGKARFGRLATLCHPDSDDPERLLIAAKLNAAWWAADDYYADDMSMGALPELLPPRLMLSMAAMDPLPPAGEFSGPLDQALAGELVMVALRSATEHMANLGTSSQVQRMCYATFSMFVSWCAYAAWRHSGKYPPAWEYLAARQHDSFYTSMTLIDAVGAYEVPADLYYEPRVRRAAFEAGTAVVLLNDLYSVTKDQDEEKPPCNMVLQVAADRQCSIDEATEIVVELHNMFVRQFEANHRALMPVPNAELQRFMRGLRAWMGGGFEWHDKNPRYKHVGRRS